MIKLLKYSLVLLLCAAVALPSWADNHKGKYERVIESTHSITSDGQVELHNKYGKIDIQTWDKNEVDLTVVITVVAKNKSKADETFDRINIEVDNGSDYFSAHTEIGESSGAWWAWWNETSDEFSIDYTIRMPEGCELSVENKYGDVFLDILNNDLDMQVKYGNFRVQELKGQSNITLGYGSGEIASAQNVEAEVKYSKLTCNQIKNAELQTKYSKVFITDAQILEVSSKYDQYNVSTAQVITNEGKYDHWDVGVVNRFEIETKYTDIEIDELSETLYSEMTYGVLKIRELGSNFKKVEGEGKYASFKIGLQGGAQYDLQAEYGSIRLPRDHQNHYELDDDNEKARKGSIGNGSGEIHLSTQYGDISLKQ